VVNIRVRRQRGAGFGADTGHHVENAGRQTGLHRQLREQYCGARCFVGRLDHDTVADGDRGCHRPGQQLHRIVPGDDVAADAEWLPSGVDMQIC